MTITDLRPSTAASVAEAYAAGGITVHKVGGVSDYGTQARTIHRVTLPADGQ